MLALLRRVVRNQEGKSPLCFYLHQLLFQPSEHVSWIFSLPPGVPVETVACLSVVRNDARASWHSLLIQELDGHAVVAVLTELFVSFLSEPVLPHVLEVIDFIIDTRRRE